MSRLTKKINCENFERKSWKTISFWTKRKITHLKSRKVKIKSYWTIKIKDLRRTPTKTIESNWKTLKIQKSKGITSKKLPNIKYYFKNRASLRINIEWVFYTNWKQLRKERLIYAEKLAKKLYLQKIWNVVSWKVKITRKTSRNGSQKKTVRDKSRFWGNKIPSSKV